MPLDSAQAELGASESDVPSGLNLATPEEREQLALARRDAARWGLALLLHSMTKGPVYRGTVSAPVIAKRRSANRVARKSRRINRLTRRGQHL